jgi:uncharacterized membrane protein
MQVDAGGVMSGEQRPARVLVAGESWMTHSIHVKGFDSFTTSSYHEGGTELLAALRSDGTQVTHQPSLIGGDAFPDTESDRSAYDAAVLSDIGANTLLASRAHFARSEPSGNRLEAIANYVRGGGGLLMVGGYLTFQGIDAKAAYCGTPVGEVLPIVLSAHDDRRERPQGQVPETVDPSHPACGGLRDWPSLLGYNRAALRDGAHLVAQIADDSLIAVRSLAPPSPASHCLVEEDFGVRFCRRL